MRTDDFFAAVRDNNVDVVSLLLVENPSLANARMRGDSTLLDGRVWQDKKVVAVRPEDARDGTALHYAAF